MTKQMVTFIQVTMSNDSPSPLLLHDYSTLQIDSPVSLPQKVRSKLGDAFLVHAATVVPYHEVTRAFGRAKLDEDFDGAPHRGAVVLGRLNGVVDKLTQGVFHV